MTSVTMPPSSLLLPEDLDTETPDGPVKPSPLEVGTPLPRLGRRDPPESAWAGHDVTEDAVVVASGDDRDWFEYEMRLRAFRRGQKLFRQARKRRRNFGSGFGHEQIMFVGQMGAKKTLSAAEEAFKWYQRGHPVFHNGGFLFGREVEGAQIYEIVDNVPMHSVILVDEAHSALESGSGTTSGVRGFVILEAGLRKKNCKLLLMSAMAKKVHPMVREMCSTVRRPLKVNIKKDDFGYTVHDPPHSNPVNFAIVWEEWRDYPFLGLDIIDGQRGGGHREGLGSPDALLLAQGESVRNAYMLIDSFRPVEPSVAMRYAGKAAMEEARAQKQQGGQLSEDHQNVIWWLDERLNQPECPANIKTAVVAMALGKSESYVGRLMSGLFGDIDGMQASRGGWKTDQLRRALAVKFNVG